MKTVKFRNYLVPLVHSGEKNSTWRLFDDKDLSVGDRIELAEFVTKQSFGQAVITKVASKPFKDLTTEDKQGHESFANDTEMYKTYTLYYQQPVGPDTLVKIIWFDLVTTNSMDQGHVSN